MDVIEVIEKYIDKGKINIIARNLSKSYNCSLMDFQIWELLLSAFGQEYKFLFNQCKKDISVHKLLNDIIMRYSPGERIIKYYVIKDHINKKNEVTLFEMNVDNSRTDICCVNGKSSVYEIKTEYDSTIRLKKQIMDYSKVFEYIYIITHVNHLQKVLDIVPEYCGIRTYELEKGRCRFITKRRSSKNFNIDSKAQIRNLTSDELKIALRNMKISNIPNSRELREKKILEVSNERKINDIFKSAIKNRYFNQWYFLRNNFDDILPIDVQSFFHSPIEPELIYSKSDYIDSFEL